ncbi:hypothetical protein CUMW_282080 [Citrus unshiu]|uniref:NB-ARC domain-containing protein n=1 Tax=Citrus unshiu TaxID=55188 RepID=A0A2H5N025_CITUN|nr:hypothetical protein CUMW_282080 [Citrus unshiu]
MAAEATIVPVVRILKELSREKFEDEGLVTQLEDSIKVLENVRKSWEEKEINDVSPKLLNAVSQVQDITDTFRIENCKRVYLGVISFRSSSIQARFRKKIKELVSGIREESEKMLLEISEKITSAENVDSAKKTGILDSNKEVNKLADFLIRSHSSLFTISVVDVAGSVMTTDLWKLYESETVKEHFQCRAWVPVPEELERRELVTDVLKQVGGSEVEKNPQTKLRNLFTKKRYLVVIINARTPDIWDILKYLFPNSSNGSRVILSFQEADAARCRNMSFFGGESSFKPKYIAYAASEDDGGNDDRALPKQVPDEEISEEVTAVVSMENDILKLANLTLNSSDKNFLISVAGAAGSGKTALVKTIYESSYTKKNFPCRAWANVYVSQDFDMRSVFADILRQLTQDEVDEESSLDDLESEFTGILYEKRYLVVLDDVHSPGAWYDLKRIFSPQASPIGSRVILITREAYVARSFSPSIFLHQLCPLNEEESGKLFLKKVESVKSHPDSNLLQKTDSLQKPDLLQKIYKLCGGLPLAISVVGGFLSNKKVFEWSGEIEKIMSGKKQGALDDQSTTLDQLSFRDISSIWVFANKSLSPHLKACLHYFRLFPKSYEVSVRRLLQLWLAERLVTPIEENYMAPEDQVKTVFDQLELMNMIEVVKRKPDGKPKTCRVPTESGGVFCIHGVSRSNATSGSSDLCPRRLAELLVNRNNSYASDKHLERLHSYLSFDNRKGDKPAAEVGNLLTVQYSKREHTDCPRVLES